jgi:hypothetical protein
MTSASFQKLCEVSENYLGRALSPEERSKLQVFHNQMALRQNARKTASWHNQEIRRRVRETLMQLLKQISQRLQENSRHFAEKIRTIYPCQ